jgi:hypothetical protein
VAPKLIYRPKLLTPNANEIIIQLVRQSFKQKKPVTINFILEQIERSFDISVSADTSSHIIQGAQELAIVDGIPIGKTRIMRDPAAIDAFCQEIAAGIQGVPRDFIINMDETCRVDFVDARKAKVIVPAAY